MYSTIRLFERAASSRTKFLCGSSRFLSSAASFVDNVVESLQNAVPHVEMSVNPYDLEAHGKGESYHPTAPPVAVVTPSNVDDVVAIVRHCSMHKIPIIPFGAGTSVEGHVAALHGGISMDMVKFDSIEFDENTESLPDPIAKVGAGVTRNRLNEALRYVHKIDIAQRRNKRAWCDGLRC